jgi:N-dimethylarginine dimethylaminohydrolase
MITFPKRNFTGSDLDGKTSKIVNIPMIDLDKSFVQYNARATNEYRHKNVVIHALNLFPMQPVMVYMQDMGFVCDSESYALSTFVQWLFRSAIRDDKPIKVAILSDRMSTMFKMWLCSVDL